jgi:hypothetical protein
MTMKMDVRKRITREVLGILIFTAAWTAFGHWTLQPEKPIARRMAPLSPVAMTLAQARR